MENTPPSSTETNPEAMQFDAEGVQTLCRELFEKLRQYVQKTEQHSVELGGIKVTYGSASDDLNRPDGVAAISWDDHSLSYSIGLNPRKGITGPREITLDEVLFPISNDVPVLLDQMGQLLTAAKASIESVPTTAESVGVAKNQQDVRQAVSVLQMLNNQRRVS